MEKTQKRLSLFLIAVFMLVSSASAVKTAVKNREYLFTYDFIIRNIPLGAREVRIWIPYPSENEYQEVEDMTFKEEPVFIKGKDAVYGNAILFCKIKSQGRRSIRLRKIYRIKRLEFSNKHDASPGAVLPVKRVPDSGLDRYFNENDFVAVTGEVRQLSSELAKGKTSAVEKARAFYDYLFENMTYDKTEPGWGEGDIKRVCLVKKGNCTDFHSFFIALCRAGGIASKFVMGVGLPEKDKADISGYHCWAEFYDPRYGWIPVDISEAWKNKNRYEYFFGAVDEKRVEFTQGRGIVLVPSPQNGEALNYFIYPYVEIDGKRSDDVETAFISRRYYAGKKGGGR